MNEPLTFIYYFVFTCTSEPHRMHNDVFLRLTRYTLGFTDLNKLHLGHVVWHAEVLAVLFRDLIASFQFAIGLDGCWW